MSAQSWFFTFEIVSGIGTALVIVGLFKEYGTDVLRAFQFWGEREHRAQVEIETSSKREGGALVVLGIAIELIATGGIFGTSLRIETQHREEVAALLASNLELKNIALPRRVAAAIFSGPDKPGPAAPLTAFPRAKALIISVPDVEAVTLATDIGGLLKSCGWNVTGQTERLSFIEAWRAHDGVTLFLPSGFMHALGTPPPAAIFGFEAAWSLGRVLEDKSISDTKLEIILRSSPPFPAWWSPVGYTPDSDTVCVFVGMKPIRDTLYHAGPDVINALPDNIRKWAAEHGLKPL